MISYIFEVDIIIFLINISTNTYFFHVCKCHRSEWGYMPIMKQHWRKGKMQSSIESEKKRELKKA